VATSAQTLFIPEKIESLRLSKLPLSADLSDALKKLQIETFAELRDVSIGEFQQVSRTASAIFAEMAVLTQAVQQSELNCLFPQNNSAVELRKPQSPFVTATVKADVEIRTNVSSKGAAAPIAPKRADGHRFRKRRQRQKVAPAKKNPAGERIHIPNAAREMPIAILKASVRLRHILENRPFRVLGDLHGVSVV
jgi:hypothetical protein